MGAPHRVPHPAPQPTPSQTSRSGALGRAESRAKGGERRSPHPRPPTERTGPARAPRSASRIPPSKIWNRWRGAALTRTSFGGSFVCRAPSMGRTTTHHRTPAERIGGPRGRLAPPRGSHLYKRCKGGKRAADAREDLERLGQWGRWRCRNSVAIALSDERRHGDARPRAGGARVFTGEAGVGRGVSQRAVAPHRARERGRVRADLLLRVYVLRTRRPRA